MGEGLLRARQAHRPEHQWEAAPAQRLRVSQKCGFSTTSGRKLTTAAASGEGTGPTASDTGADEAPCGAWDLTHQRPSLQVRKDKAAEPGAALGAAAPPPQAPLPSRHGHHAAGVTRGAAGA